MWSPSHNYSRSITPDSSGCSDSEPESPSDARVFKAPAPLPEMWHTAFDSPPMDGTSTALEERSFSPDRATTSTAESTRRRFRYSPFRPATSASHRAQRAYARAIVASIPAADEELRQAVRDDVARATAGWNACGACIGEEEVTGQLARLGETFGYLTQLYEHALSKNSHIRAEQIIQRGKVIIAAVRLLAGQIDIMTTRSPARGTDPRNPSIVSTPRWKPHREIALAEKISERRRLRAQADRLAAREKRIHQRVQAETELMNAPEKRKTWTEDLMEQSIKRRAKVVQEAFAQLHGGDAPIYNRIRRPISGLFSTDSMDSTSSRKGSSRRERIKWRIPDYNAGQEDVVIATMIHPDQLQQVHTIRGKHHPGSLVIPQPLDVSQSLEDISPRTTPGPPAPPELSSSPFSSSNGTNITTEGHATSSTEPTTPDSSLSHHYRTNKILQEQFPPEPASPASSRPSFRRLRTVLKRVSSPMLRRFKGSTNQSSYSINSSASETPFEPIPPVLMPHFSAALREPRRSSSIIKLPQIRPRKTVDFPPPASRESSIAKLAVVTVLENTVTTSEVVAEHTPTPTKSSLAPAFEEEPLTRTEREYQDLLEELQHLKRELRSERDGSRRERRARDGRGRRPERSSRRVSASSETVKARSRSRDVERWLGDMEI